MTHWYGICYELRDNPIVFLYLPRRQVEIIVSSGTNKPTKPKPSDMAFDYDLDFSKIDFSLHPELYRIGKGEQGVLLVEPYKSQILPHWKFKTVVDAKKSSKKIYSMFLAYLKNEDFPGADMARKFLQMGWTRARRYANHAGGRKYDKATGTELPRTVDDEKAEVAAIFYERYVAARQHAKYLQLKDLHVEKFQMKGRG